MKFLVLFSVLLLVALCLADPIPLEHKYPKETQIIEKDNNQGVRQKRWGWGGYPYNSNWGYNPNSYSSWPSTNYGYGYPYGNYGGYGSYGNYRNYGGPSVTDYVFY